MSGFCPLRNPALLCFKPCGLVFVGQQVLGQTGDPGVAADRQGRPLPVLAGGWRTPVKLTLRHLCPSAVSSRCVCSTWWSQDKETQALDSCPAAGDASEARGISCDPGTQPARGDNTSSRPFLLVSLGLEEHSSTQQVLRAALLSVRGHLLVTVVCWGRSWRAGWTEGHVTRCSGPGLAW